MSTLEGDRGTPTPADADASPAPSGEVPDLALWRLDGGTPGRWRACLPGAPSPARRPRPRAAAQDTPRPQGASRR